MITDKQKIACFLLRNGEKVNTAALACGVHRCTVWRWFRKKDVIRRYRLYCEFDRRKAFGLKDLKEIWDKYQIDRDALLKAVNGGNRDAIAQMYSHIIHDYYEPLDGKIELRMARRRRKES